MYTPKIGFMTFGHPYFDPLADKTGLIESVMSAWGDLPFTLIPSSDIPVDVAGTVRAAEFFGDQKVDGIIINAGAYGFENLISVFALNTSLPLMVWCPHNSPQALIPASSFLSIMANLNNLDRKAFHVLGNMDDKEVQQNVIAFSRASRASGMLRKATLGMVGAVCPGMLDTGFSEYHVRRFVPGLLSLDTTDILDAMGAATDAEVKEAMEKIRETFANVSAEDQHLLTAARSYVAMKNIAHVRKLDAMTVRCWPELSQKGFSGALGVSLMCDEGTVCMMERDVPATATALALQYLTGGPSHIGEIDHVDPGANEAFYVNDTSMIPSLAADKDENEVAGGDLFIMLTSGRTDGIMLKGTLKPGAVTIAKLKGTPGNENLLSMGIVTGKVMPLAPGADNLCNARVKYDLPVNDVLNSWAENGLEHHMVINHNRVVMELSMLSEMMGISPVVIQ